MPLQATSGAASYDAFGGGVPFEPIYIEQVFQNWLYTGNGSTQTITNGIDLSTKGGLVWIKDRDSGAKGHALFDTARGVNLKLQSQSTNGQFSGANQLTAFNTTGFALGSATDPNGSGTTYVSWTFRKQPKFYTQGTFTGDGTTNKVITHDLGGTTGFIIVKRTDSTGNWSVWHRSFADTKTYAYLNTTAAAVTAGGADAMTVTDNSFTVGTNQIFGNGSGFTYVYYVFAHNAGGFGLTGTDNVISCGSYTGDSASAGKFVSLGYEPQWVLQKCVNSAGTDWHIQDVMRGAPVPSASGKVLRPNSSIAEYDGTNAYPAATGFYATGDDNNSGDTYIYIAIRRGPMKTPTTGTSVFTPVAYTGNGSANRAITTGLVPDLVWWKGRSNGTDWKSATMLIGTLTALTQNTTGAESSVPGYYINTYNNTGFTYGTSDASYNTSGRTYVVEGFSRAPGFMDVVCYSGTGGSQSINHNLTVVPEFFITKPRTEVNGWLVYQKDLGVSKYLSLQSTAAADTFTWTQTPTASTIGFLGGGGNNSGINYVAYLFASCPGVSKVGSYTGTGTTQTINCGFTAGARFVLIKRTDSTGDWYVWDSARGIVAGNDPYLLVNSALAEVTNTDYIDTASTGFEISSTAPAAINASGGSFIFLAIA